MAARDFEAGVSQPETGECNRAKDHWHLLDPGGKALSSEELSDFVQALKDRSSPVIFAIGGADGFTSAAHKAA